MKTGEMEPIGTITVLGEPRPKGSVDTYGKGAPVVHRNKDWERTIHWEALKQWRLLNQAVITAGAIGLRLTFHLSRGKTVRRETPWVRPDIDKLERAVLDGLTGVVFKDDAQVTRIVAVKRYADTEPGVVIEVSA